MELKEDGGSTMSVRLICSVFQFWHLGLPQRGSRQVVALVSQQRGLIERFSRIVEGPSS